MNTLQKISQEQAKQDRHPDFVIGDTIKVHYKIKEGGKERIQIFEGLVIARKGSSVNASFTVRKISYGEGVERVFPLHTPRIAKIEVLNKGKVRRAKLHYLRGRVGKRALLVKSAGLVHALARARLGDTLAADEASAEALFRAARGIRTLRDPVAYPRWLARIAAW